MGHINVTNDIAGVALLLSFISILLSELVSLSSKDDKIADYIFEDNIRQKENKLRQEEKELKHIRDSIDTFYVPLQNLLTVYNENVTNEVKLKIINEINGHKHLAEPRVRCVFEKYLQERDGSNKGSNKGSKKLLELVSRDIEVLQNRFIELNMALKEQ